MRKRTTRRGLVGLAAALIGGLLVLGWWQVRARTAGQPSPIMQLVVELLSPSLRMGAAARNAITPEPRYTTTPMTPVGIARLRQLEEENRQLRALLSLRDGLPQQAIAAEVIGRDTVPWEGYLLLGKGKKAGIAPHMVVLTPDGVLGQIATVTPHTAGVLLLTDPASGIGARIARSGAVGVLKGSRNGHCEVRYLSGAADVQPGDLVVSSGLGEVFPAGLPLGRVTGTVQDAVLSSKTARVEPAANPATARWVVVTRR